MTGKGEKRMNKKRRLAGMTIPGNGPGDPEFWELRR
jgi:hypothetical protein